jgi:hypothetical protein
MCIRWPPPWSNGQTSWLQIQTYGFDSRRYKIFWEVVGLERGPLSLVSTIEELLERKSSGSGLESRDYGRRDPLHCTLYPQKLALISPTSGGRSVGIVSSRTQAREFFFSVHKMWTFLYVSLLRDRLIINIICKWLRVNKTKNTDSFLYVKLCSEIGLYIPWVST